MSLAMILSVMHYDHVAVIESALSICLENAAIMRPTNPQSHCADQTDTKLQHHGSASAAWPGNS